MKKEWLVKTLALSVVILFISVSFHPMVAENTISVEKKQDYNNVDIFKEAKEYLLQTLIDTSNNPDVKELLKQNNQKMFTSDYDYKSAFSQILFKKPRLLKSILFTKPKMTYEYLESNYDKGLEIEKIIGKKETSKMMESVKISNQDFFNELKNIIVNDKGLSNRILVLKEKNNEKISLIGSEDWEYPIICFTLLILFFSIVITFALFEKIDQFLEKTCGIEVAGQFKLFYYYPLEITFLLTLIIMCSTPSEPLAGFGCEWPICDYIYVYNS